MRLELDELVGSLYLDLRAIAQAHLRNERAGHTLGATALVNEAYLRLAGHEKLPLEDSSLFLGAASRTMRRVLVDHARARNRLKRGSGVTPEELDERVPSLSEGAADQLLALDEALSRLALVDPRAAEVVERRFFGGFGMSEIARELGISRKTAQRDWTAALALLRAWIADHVTPLPRGSSSGPLSNATTGKR